MGNDSVPTVPNLKHVHVSRLSLGGALRLYQTTTWLLFFSLIVLMCILAFAHNAETAEAVSLVFLTAMLSTRVFYAHCNYTHYGQPFWKVILIEEYLSKNQAIAFLPTSHWRNLEEFVSSQSATGKNYIRALVQTRTTLDTKQAEDIVLGPLDQSYVAQATFAELQRRGNKRLA